MQNISDINYSIFLKALSAFLCFFGFMCLACIWNVYRLKLHKKTSEVPVSLVLRIIFFVSKPFDNIIGKLLVKIPSLNGLNNIYSRNLLLAGLERRLKPSHIYTAQLFWTVIFMLLFKITGNNIDEILHKSFYGLMLTVCGIICGIICPWKIVKLEAEHRQEMITRSLPFAIDLMSSAMRAGMDFWAALKYYVDIQPMGVLEREFAILLQEREHQLAEDIALKNFAHRIGSMAAASFSGSIIHAHKVGAPLGKTMEMFGDEIRRERFELAEQKGGKAVTLLLFPCFFFTLPSVLCFVFGPIAMKLMDSSFFR